MNHGKLHQVSRVEYPPLDYTAKKNCLIGNEYPPSEPYVQVSPHTALQNSR